MIKNAVEFCGRHPFATGLLSLLSVFGLLFSFYSFALDRDDANSSRNQVADLQETIARLEETAARLRPSADIPELPFIDGYYVTLRSGLTKNGWRQYEPILERHGGKVYLNGSPKQRYDLKTNIDEDQRALELWYNASCGENDDGCMFRFLDEYRNVLVVRTSGAILNNGRDFSKLRVETLEVWPPDDDPKVKRIPN